MLKKSDNTVSRRQEIGRGLRLAVDQHGERMDNPVTVHDINELTVVTDESYTDFVAGLQKEIAESLAARPRKASVKFFTGKTIRTESGESLVEEKLATAIYFYLVQNGYVDEEGQVTSKYKEDKEAGTLAAPTAERLKPVIDSRLAAGGFALHRPASADRRPQAEEDSAQRSELCQEGVPGPVGADQPQGRLSGRVRLRGARRQVRRRRSTSTSTSLQCSTSSRQGSSVTR